MEFAQPKLLWLLLFIPAILLLYIIYLRQKKSSAQKFSTILPLKQAKGISKVRPHLPFFFILISVACLCIALADPMIPLKSSPEGVSVVLALDVSGSMAAQDYEPTRMVAARSAGIILVQGLKPEDYAGIVTFEAGASTAAYLTPSKEMVIERLKILEQRTGPTAIGDGLSLAVDMASSLPNKKKIVVLLSDGVSNAGQISIDDAISYARSRKVQVYTVAMGSNQPVIIGYDIFGKEQYAELDEVTLNRIAAQTNGVYFKSVDVNVLNEIYSTIAQNIEREDVMASIKDRFIFGSFISLLITLFIIYGKYRIVT